MKSFEKRAKTRSEYLFNLVDTIADKRGVSIPQIIFISTLKNLPSETLGRSVADFLEANKLEPLKSGPRRKQLHDTVHVLTGYGTDLIGEAEVQAFLIGAKFHPVNLLLGAFVVMSLFKNNLYNDEVLQRLQTAYQRGQNSGIDVDKWEAELEWEKPLVEVQRQLKISLPVTI